ncbi:hypothetical protein BN873_310016 [Candidatus Competibacter denitrificans Run_A_D11]|uniref:Uncharacterized protein n=1 Tax=Candidatus Competibacter denitrificans Run_A_D11 TaxID=1400863 RepID=W6M482_9GAMM|nr:hypothetical protein BN873_310016 [Candidatus Competibacter denitrificans Run_A_D11]
MASDAGDGPGDCDVGGAGVNLQRYAGRGLRPVGHPDYSGEMRDEEAERDGGGGGVFDVDVDGDGFHAGSPHSSVLMRSARFLISFRIS